MEKQMKQAWAQRMATLALSGALSTSVVCGVGAEGPILLTNDVMASASTFISVPGVDTKVSHSGTIHMSGTKTEADAFVRHMDKNGNYTKVNGERFHTEDRERHFLIAAFSPGAEVSLLGDNQSTYSVDAIVSTAGGHVTITGKELTSNLIYMTTPLSTSKYAKPNQNGKMSITLSGNLVTHNDDWDRYPRMDGFHYYHSSNLYSRGGISVNGNNELNIEAKEVHTRYLRNSDWHHGEGKAAIHIKADVFDMNRLGRSAYTPDGKSDEQWTLGKTENDKGGLFQFYGATTTIDAKTIRIGGVREGQKAREDDLTADRIDIDAGNRAHIFLGSERTETITHDGEMRAIDGADITVRANESVTGRNAFAGFTDNYRYGSYSGGGYQEGIAYYGDGDEPNTDPSIITVTAPTITMEVSHQAEEGGYNHVGFGFIGAGQKGTVNLIADKNLTIRNAWNGFENKGPNSVTMRVSAGGVVNLTGEDILLEGAVVLGEKTKPYDVPIYNAAGKRERWDYHSVGSADHIPGLLHIVGKGKDRGSLTFGGEINGVNSNLSIEKFKHLHINNFTGLWDSQSIGMQATVRDVGTLVIDPTYQWHIDHHEGQLYHKEAGKGHMAINATAGGKSNTHLDIVADHIDVRGVMAFSETGKLTMQSPDMKIYRLLAMNGAQAKLEGDSLYIATEALTGSYKSKLSIHGRDITVAGEPYYVHPERDALSDKSVVGKGIAGTLAAVGTAKLDISVDAHGMLRGRVVDTAVAKTLSDSNLIPDSDIHPENYDKTSYAEAYGRATVNLQEGATWSYTGHSAVHDVVSQGARIDMTQSGTPSDSLYIHTLTGPVTVAFNVGDPVASNSSRTRRAASIVADGIRIGSMEAGSLHLEMHAAQPDTLEKAKGATLVTIDNPGNTPPAVTTAVVASPNAVMALQPNITLQAQGGGVDVVLDSVQPAGLTPNANAPMMVMRDASRILQQSTFGAPWQRLQNLQQQGRDGIWVDMQHTHQTGENLTTKGQQYTLGFDQITERSYGHSFLGGAVTQYTGTGHADAVHSDLKETTAALYGGIRRDNGLYLQGWLDAGQMRSTYHTTAADTATLSGSVWHMGLELGKFYGKGQGRYLMPAVGIAYGQWNPNSSVSAQGLTIMPGHIQGTLARMGITYGKTETRGHYYVTGALLHNFGGNVAYGIQDAVQDVYVTRSGQQTWAEIGVGGDMQFASGWQLQANVKARFGQADVSGWTGGVQLQYKF